MPDLNCINDHESINQSIYEDDDYVYNILDVAEILPSENSSTDLILNNNIKNDRIRFSLQEEDYLIEKLFNFYISNSNDPSKFNPDGLKLCSEFNIKRSTLETIRQKTMNKFEIYLGEVKYPKTLQVTIKSQIIISKQILAELKNEVSSLLAKDIYLVNDELKNELDEKGRIIITNISFEKRKQEKTKINN